MPVLYCAVSWGQSLAAFQKLNSFLHVSSLHHVQSLWSAPCTAAIQKTNLKIAFNCDNLSDWNSSDVLKIRSIHNGCVSKSGSVSVCFCRMCFLLYRFFAIAAAYLFHTIFAPNHIKYVCQHLPSTFVARVHSGYNFRYIFSGKYDRIACFSWNIAFYFCFVSVFHGCYRTCFSFVCVCEQFLFCFSSHSHSHSIKLNYDKAHFIHTERDQEMETIVKCQIEISNRKAL